MYTIAKCSQIPGRPTPFEAASQLADEGAVVRRNSEETGLGLNDQPGTRYLIRHAARVSASQRPSAYRLGVAFAPNCVGVYVAWPKSEAYQGRACHEP